MTTAEELRGWDEIAQYLGVSSRTAQSYEREHGLPVRRMPGTKGRVWALAADLDHWRKGHKEDGGAERVNGESTDLGSKTEPSADIAAQVSDASYLTNARVEKALNISKKRRIKHLIALPAALGVAAIVIYLTLLMRHPVGQPTSFRVEANILRTFDARGKPVWEYTLPPGPPGINSEIEHPLYGPNGLFAELHGDGKTDLLFKVATQAVGPNRLYCFNAAGKVAWSRSVGPRRQVAIRGDDP